MDKFDRILSSVIDSHLGLRSKLIGYQYSEIIRAIFSVFCCGGDCMEDLNLYLKDVLAERPHTRVPSADTVLRGIEELATENISYTAEKTGNVYDFNTAERLNQLLIKLLLATGQLAEGGEYDVDFDHQFLEAEKYDSKRTYKGFDGYSPGVFTIGGLIAYTMFLLITAMAANFYRYIVALPLMAVLFGIKATDRVKSFLFRFIAVPAKWVRTARQYKLNIYSNKPYKLIWEHG